MISIIYIIINLLFIISNVHSTLEFDNARIIGKPVLKCSSTNLTLSFESNIQFQGRISVTKKMFIPECNQEFSSNMDKNATFSMPIATCAETTFLMNGTRIFEVVLEISFHPLVTTKSTTVYSLSCTELTERVIPKEKKDGLQCSHSVRKSDMAEGTTTFRTGDYVVHQWKCSGTDAIGTVIRIISCNAIAYGGQIIHLIDENGCVVDSELMGEIRYQDSTSVPTAYSNIFNFQNEERFRIECSLLICKKNGNCSGYVSTPKCSFSKEELLLRNNSRLDYEKKNMLQGFVNYNFDYQLKTSSEWLTVSTNYRKINDLHYNFYTVHQAENLKSDKISTHREPVLENLSKRFISNNAVSSTTIPPPREILVPDQINSSNSVWGHVPENSTFFEPNYNEENETLESDVDNQEDVLSEEPLEMGLGNGLKKFIASYQKSSSWKYEEHGLLTWMVLITFVSLVIFGYIIYFKYTNKRTEVIRFRRSYY